MNDYTATYEAITVLGEHGYSYVVSSRGREVFSGWSRGRKANAEAEVREGINAREALRECAGLSCAAGMRGVVVKTIEIKNRWTGAVLYATQVDDSDQYAIRTALERAVASDANLSGANLSGAYLGGAYLSGAYLRGANLRGANLRGANLSDANLRGANLRGANLSDANLRGAKYEDVPRVPKLDAKLLKIVESGEGALQMSSWHTCETTHCRAGWAVHLAGKEGYELEKKLGSTAAAGALIYQRSTGRIPDFYASDEDALADIVACAADQGADV